MANVLFGCFTAWACIAIAYCIDDIGWHGGMLPKVLMLPVSNMALIVVCVILSIMGILH